ncbi:hypothetical protein [Mycobacterium montefiorense]|uniref:Lipoprotein LppN n=1 Tax=Mycobacterium montefiorense TaxID=154654 RepID=A0AA37PID5_9MYCO|nr:hypothetical protein [Mycobacterium montefiorense]GBG37318.1 putative lipoprotein LppN [Mycobacterium montefiorense]GKU35818.1 putative lipoprotein LppN [Mycobacterium montefiorense]GKU39783.1 putative lipoprotein LppN [Mycobacterium montefiorense]GKU47657.1 putative lipoprotein LppN [Mycobacterium montefiorense]GKU48877.1 putative lipoprotein LppN [Mycobacterium montefiorense]
MRRRSPHALCGLAAVTLLAGCGSDPARNTITPHATAKPSTTTAAELGSHTEKWINLQVGDCVADLPPADLSRVTITVVDCATAHLAEVYLRAPMAVDTAIVNVANRDCSAGFAPYTGKPLGSGAFSITYLIDSNQDRTGADPTPSTLICLLQSGNGQPLTGSAHR